jgi:iron complex outermembrane receptor protein
MFGNWKLRLLVTALPSLVLAATLPANAFAADQASATKEQSTQLEEVVVTANRREENQQTVPIAITSIGGDAVEKLGIGNTMALGEAIPNVVFGRQSNGSIPFIRGVGNQNSTPGDEPAVAMYVDDVYMPLAGSGISNYNSIDRLEVEKGPQGTLFGRNATGGVVQIHTRDPEAKPTLDATVGYANYQTISGSVYASSPLTDTLTANFAGYASQQNTGYGRNLTTGNPTYGDERFSGARAKLLWKPSDRTSFLLNVDYDATRTGLGITYRAAPGTKTTGVFFGGVVPGASSPAPAGFFDTYTNMDNITNNYQGGGSLKVVHNADWGSITSVTAYRTSNDQEYFDLDAGRAKLLDTYLHGVDKTWTQELRVASPDNASIKWIAGLFYFNDKAGYLPIRFQTFAAPVYNFASSYGLQKTDSYAAFVQGSKEIFSRTNLTLGLRYTSDRRSVQDSYNSSDIQASLPGTPSGIAPICPAQGLVFTNVLAGSFAPGCLGGSDKVTYSKLSYRLSLDHHFTDDFMGYAAYNRGFKSGLFNVVVLFSPLDPPVSPETLDAFTIGEKAEFMDHRLRLNAEAFYYNYKNLQVQAVINGTSKTTNAAKASMQGVEMDLTARASEHLTVSAALGFQSGKYDDFPNGFFLVYDPINGGNCTLSSQVGGSQCGLTAATGGFPPHYVAGTATTGASWNLKGNKVPNLPPFSASLSLQYDIPVSYGKWDANLAWNHSGNYYFNADNGGGQIAPSTPDNNKQKSMDLFNGSLGWASKSGTFTARLWGRNITDVKYIAFGLLDADAVQWAVAPPRTFGINLGVHY